MPAPTSRRRIGLLIDTLIGGGAERVVMNFAEKFSSLGHDVHVILLKHEIEHDLRDASYRVHWVSEDGNISRHRAVNKFLLAKKLRALIFEIESDGRRFDFFTSNAEDMDRISRMARLPNVYIRYRNSMVQYLESKLGSRTGLKRAIRRWRWRQKFRYIYGGRNIVTVSQALRNEIVDEIGVRPRSITTIYNPFDFSRLRALAQEPAALPAEPYIIYAAKFENRKRQDVLLRAFARLSVPHRLVLLGGTYTDSDRQWLGKMERLITELGLEGRVVLPGFQHNPYPWVKNAALFAMASDGEGLPTVLIESLILGTPVVSTDCRTGPREILIGPLSEYLSTPGDDAALAANISKALHYYPPIAAAKLERFDADFAIARYLEHCVSERVGT
jgi:glycosyltransferase involved in cell wall biosynthesis